MENDDGLEIVHTPCGKDVRFCLCQNAPVVWNPDTEMFESEEFLDED